MFNFSLSFVLALFYRFLSFILYPCLFLTIQPDGMVKFAHERADLPVRKARTQTGEYYGIRVDGTLIADARDSTTRIDQVQRDFI